jgi:hypothetical protein
MTAEPAGRLDWILYLVAGFAVLVMLLANTVVFLIALTVEGAAIGAWVGVRRARQRRRLRPTL